MQTFSRRAFQLLTHATLAVTGCLIYSRFRPGSHSQTATVASLQKTGARGQPAVRGAAEILAGVEAKLPAKPSAEENKARGEQFTADALRAIHDLPPEANPEAALNHLLESTHPAPGEAGWKPAPEMAALIYQWLLKDPVAYGEWVWADSSHTAVSARFLGVAIGEAMKVPGAIDKLLRDAGSTSSWGADNIRRAMAGELARVPDSGHLAVVKDLIPPDQWKDFCQNLSYQWPPDRREALLAFAIQQNQPGMISGLANNYQSSTPESERESSVWLIKMMDDPALPADFRQALLADKSFCSAIAWNSSAPLALRVQFSEGATESEKYESLCRADLSRALSNSIDWPGLIRSGDATAAEVLAAATQASPELAASAPAELRDQVFAQLAVENTPAAMKLLDGLPEDDRNDAILNAIRTRFQRASPDAFLQVIQQVPANDPALWESRVDAWNSGIVWLSRNSTGDFTAWVEDLPAGPDREIALYSLARSRERSDGGTAARLRSQITDPRLLQKISEKR